MKSILIALTVIAASFLIGSMVVANFAENQSLTIDNRMSDINNI